MKEGHRPNTTNAIVELHRLLSIFMASKSFAFLKSSGRSVIQKIQEVEEGEITRILLYLAIIARVVDDREGRVFEVVGSDCGLLQKNLDLDATQCLDLREACNKIIHAKKIEFDVDKVGSEKFLNPSIYLYGEQGKLKWKANLDVVKFCEEYAAIVCHF